MTDEETKRAKAELAGLTKEEARAFLAATHQIGSEDNEGNNKLRSAHNLKTFQAQYLTDQLPATALSDPENYYRTLRLNAEDKTKFRAFLVEQEPAAQRLLGTDDGN